jgi:hypothetical protein
MPSGYACKYRKKQMAVQGVYNCSIGNAGVEALRKYRKPGANPNLAFVYGLGNGIADGLLQTKSEPAFGRLWQQREELLHNAESE